MSLMAVFYRTRSSKGRCQNSKSLDAAKMLQLTKATYNSSYIGWLQLAAEYESCSQ